MTRDEIQAEFDNFIEFPTDDKSCVSTASAMLFAEIIAKMAAAKEREECAKVCDEMDSNPEHLHPNDCAEAIRSRGME